MPGSALRTPRFAGLMDEIFDSRWCFRVEVPVEKRENLQFWNNTLKDVDSLKFQKTQVNSAATINPGKCLTIVFRPPVSRWLDHYNLGGKAVVGKPQRCWIQFPGDSTSEPRHHRAPLRVSSCTLWFQ